jgi:hypothetical protein
MIIIMWITVLAAVTGAGLFLTVLFEDTPEERYEKWLKKETARRREAMLTEAQQDTAPETKTQTNGK